MFVTVKTVNGGKFGNGTRYKPVERGNMIRFASQRRAKFKKLATVKNFFKIHCLESRNVPLKLKFT